MTTITPFPPVPSRADPANFPAKGDAFFSAFPQFQIEANALAAEVSAAAMDVVDASAAAVGAANYQGDYNAGTTYTVGQSVSYIGNVYVAKVTTVGVLPTNTANWLLIESGRGAGGTLVTGNTILTNLSVGSQNISTTTYGQSVTLPAADTVKEGTGNFSLNNTGDYDLAILNNAGTLLGFVAPRCSVFVSLSDNSTPAGSWVLLNSNDIGISAGAVVGAGATGTSFTYQVIPGFNNNKTLHLIGANNVGNFSVVAAAYDEVTKTFGSFTSILSISGAAVATTTFRAALDTVSQAFVVAAGNASTAGAVIGVTTTGVINVLSSAIQTTNPVTNLERNSNAPLFKTGSSYVVCDSFKAGTTQRIIAFSISGTSVTVGASVALTTVSGSRMLVIPTGSATNIAVIYASAATTYTHAPYQVTGTTLAQGTTSTLTVTATSPHFRLFSVNPATPSYLLIHQTNTDTSAAALLLNTNPAAATFNSQSAAVNAHLGSVEYLVLNTAEILEAVCPRVSATLNIRLFTVSGSTLATTTSVGTTLQSTSRVLSLIPTGVANQSIVVVADLSGRWVSLIRLSKGNFLGSDPMTICTTGSTIGAGLIDLNCAVPLGILSDGSVNPLTLVSGNKYAGIGSVRFNASATAAFYEPVDNLTNHPMEMVMISADKITTQPKLQRIRTSLTFSTPTNGLGFIQVSKGNTPNKSWVLEVTANTAKIVQIEMT